MRKLFYISVTLCLLAAAVGCSRGVDKRLVLADTLMWKNPDSSLAILSSINRDSLMGDENLAYHALLLTQAQFRCNGNCTTDTLINSALDHYSDNHNREHYTRALLYKGAFYEERENPVEAMKWYKQAEDNADTTDYRNLAQINMRMGMLYYNNYASNNLDLEKFKKALHYYTILEDKKMIMNTMLYCGNVARITNRKLAENNYKKALPLAKEMNDSNSLFDIYINCGLMYVEDSLYNKAKEHILEAFKLHTIDRNNYHYYMLGLIYAKLGMLDSANYFIELPDKHNNTTYDSLMMFNALKEMALMNDNVSQYKKLNNSFKSISNTLEYNDTKYQLHDYETDFNYSKDNDSAQHIGRLNRFVVLLLLSLFLLSVVFTLYHLKKKHDFQKLISQIQKEKANKFDRLNNELMKLNNKFGNDMLVQINALKNIMNEAYCEPADPQSTHLEHKVPPIDDSDTDFWNGLYDYLNHKFNNIIKNIEKEYPKLPPKDLNVIGLLCCGFNDAEIAVCKGYRNGKTVKARRNKIRNKMNLNVTLVEYLQLKMCIDGKSNEA